MALSIDDATVPLTATAHELAAALESRELVWAWVDEGSSAGRLVAGDSVGIVAPSRSCAGLLPVIDAGGVAIVAEPGDARAPLGFVRALWRDRRCWALDRQPWRASLATGSLPAWRAAERAWKVAGRAAAAIEQLASPPSAEHVDEVEARFYGIAEVLGAYRLTTLEDLSPTEAILATRFIKDGDRVVVIGCGTGRETLALARRGMRAVGLDVCPAAIASARQSARDSGAGDVSFETMSILRLELPSASFDVAIVASDVLAGIPGRARRVAALSAVSDAVRAGGVVAVAANAGSGPARALLEAPRALLRGLGLYAGEPGDRVAWQGPPPTRRYYHAYADDAEIARELAPAALAYKARIGGFVVARRASANAREVVVRFGRSAEIARAAAATLRVERARRSAGPAALVTEARRLAKRAPRRNALERANLRAAIAWCDRAWPRGAGCYRRALVEMALDAGAAEEPLALGFRRDAKGHAWVGSASAAEERFDWIVEA